MRMCVHLGIQATQLQGHVYTIMHNLFYLNYLFTNRREIVNTFKGSIFKVHRNLYDFLVTCFPMIETHLSPYPTNEKLLHLCASGDLESVLEEV